MNDSSPGRRSRRRAKTASAGDRSPRDARLLRTLVAALPGLAWLKAPDGSYLCCNAAFERLCGQSEGAVVGKTDRDLFAPEPASTACMHDAEALATGRPWTGDEWWSFAPDASHGLFEVTRSPLFGEDGASIGVLGVARDVSASRRADGDESRVQERLTLALQASGTGVYDADLSTGEAVIGGGLPARLGYAAGEFRGTKHEWLSLVHPDDRPALEAQLAESDAGRCDCFDGEYRLRTRSGDWVWVLHKGRTQRDASGRATRELGVLLPISDRNEMELRLRESEARARSIFEALPVAMLLVSEDGRIAQVNAAAAATFGYGRDQLEGASIEQLVPDRVRAAHPALRAAYHRDPHPVRLAQGRQVTARHADGHEFPVDVSLAPVQLEGVCQVIASVVDLAEQRAAESGLRRVRERLDAAIEGAGIGIWEFDAATQELHWDDTMRRLYGLPPGGPVVVADWVEALLPADRDEQHALWERALRGEAAYDTVFRIRRRDGEVRHIRSFAFIQKDASGAVERTVGINWDVTEGKRAEELQLRYREELEQAVEARTAELLQSQRQTAVMTERLRLATDAAEIGVWEWRVPENELIWDERMFSLYGTSPDAFTSAYDAWSRALHPDDKLRAEREVQRAVEGLGEFRTAFRIVRPDGAVRHIKALARTRKGDDGRVRGMVGVNRDITVLKEAERELERKEQRWLIALEAHDMGVWDWNVATGEVIFSPRLLTMLGYQPGDWRNAVEEWQSRIHPDDRARVTTSLENHLAGRAPRYAVEMRLRCRDGSDRWILDCGKVLERDAAGQPLRMIGTHTDIDEQKRVEAESSQLGAIVEASGDLIAMADTAGRLTYMNRAGRRMLGIPDDEPLTSICIADCHDAETYRYVAEVGLPTAIEQGLWFSDNTLKRRDGSSLPVSQLIIAKRDAGDREAIEVLATICRDITERKRTEAALQEREETFRCMFEGSLDPVLLLQDDRFIECNDAATVLLGGIARDEIVGRTPVDFSPEFQPNGRRSDEYATEILRTARQGMPCRFDWQWLRRDGADVFVEVSLTALHLQGRQALYCGLRDITERRRLETALAEARDQAQAASRAKSRFLANMSHEIRTPMNAILGLTHLLMERSVDIEQTARLGKVSDAAQHLLSILNDILDISKIESGKLHLRIANLELAPLFDAVEALFGATVSSKGLGWQVEIDPTLRGELAGDPMRLRQILVNFVSNAVKFTEQGRITLRAYRVDSAPESFLVRFEVEDTGIGIPPEAMNRLFSAFEQADTEVTRRHGGTGLGLAISKRLVHLMGGEIGVDSVPGGGSRVWFTVRLPHAGTTVGGGGPAAHAASLAPTAAAVRARAAGARILLAEDNALNREVILDLLSDCGLLVDVAVDGGEVVDKAAEHGYALILMDMQMPIMDGLTATKQIRAMPGRATVPILALTANVFDEDRAASLQAGLNEHLGKPIEPQLLFGALLRWLPGEAVDGYGATDDPAMGPDAPDEGSERAVRFRLAAVQGLDTTQGLEYVGDQMEVYVRVLRLFADRCMGDTDALRVALAAGELEEARRIAHTIKGNAAVLGAVALQPLAARLEVAIKSGAEMLSVLPLMEAMATEYEALADRIRGALGA